LIGQELNFNDPFFNFFAHFNINTAGFIIVGAFAATWAIAVLWWHFGNVEEKWDAKMIHHEPVEATVSG
jgi:high-affinity nickel-transport protein